MSLKSARRAGHAAAFVPALASCLALAAVFAAGCAQQESSAGGGGAASPAPAASSGAPSGAGASAALKVGLITPGKITDQGWNQSANDGLQKIKTELGAQVGQPIEAPALSDVAADMRNLAQSGDNLVFGHGSEYDDAAKSVAASVPDTTLVVMGGRSAGAPNLFPIEFASDQATYLAGMVAGGMTRTNKIGLVGPQKIPIIQQSFAAFERGVKAVNPKAEVKEAWVGSEDIAKAKQQTQALLDSGADVIMHNANEGGKGVADAVMAKDGAMFIGANSDQSDLATPKNLGSFILDVPSAMVAVAKQVQSGTKGGKAYTAGAKDGAVYFKYNDKYAGTIPADLKTKVDAAKADIASGKLDPSK